MFADCKILVKNSNMEVIEMTTKELSTNKYRDDMSVFSMLYIPNGITFDFVPYRQVQNYKNNGSGLYKFTYETPEGIRRSIICDKDTEILAGGENFYDTGRPRDRQYWTSFTSMFNIDECVYIIDIAGKKCKKISLEKLKSSEEPEDLYIIKTKTKNVFVNGILVKCR